MTTELFGRSIFFKTLIAAGFAAGINAGAYADPAVPPAPHSDSVGTAAADSLITVKVKSQFVDDGRLKKSDISVSTVNGVVTLSGSASSSQAQFAEAIAAHVQGVSSVDNELKSMAPADTASDKMDRMAVHTKRVVSDSWITTKVKSEILADSVSKGFDVSVSTRHGVVALKGTLASQDAIDHVKDLTGQVRGVKSVDISLLVVASS